MKRANGRKTGNYDSATPLLPWLRLHKNGQINEAQGETEATQNGQQRRAILNAKCLVADSTRLGEFFSFME